MKAIMDNLGCEECHNTLLTDGYTLRCIFKECKYYNIEFVMPTIELKEVKK